MVLQAINGRHAAAKELYLTWYRIYDPVHGRWLSRDTFGTVVSQMNAAFYGTTASDYYKGGVDDPEALPPGANLYWYVGKSPGNLGDSEGEVLPLLFVAGALYFASAGDANAPGDENILCKDNVEFHPYRLDNSTGI